MTLDAARVNAALARRELEIYLSVIDGKKQNIQNIYFKKRNKERKKERKKEGREQNQLLLVFSVTERSASNFRGEIVFSD